MKILKNSSGKIVKLSNGKINAGSSGDDCCCDDECPATAGEVTTPSTLGIAGYVDGFLTRCPSCPAGSPYPAWDGTLTYGAAGGPYWNPASTALSINGSTIGLIQLNWGDPADLGGDCWALLITCNSPGGNVVVWYGQHTGHSPLGAYSYFSGCASSVTSLVLA